MTPDQAQTRAVARLMDMRDEGLTPGDAVAIEIAALFILIVGLSNNREEAENGVDAITEALDDALAQLKPRDFGVARKKGKR